MVLKKLSCALLVLVLAVGFANAQLKIGVINTMTGQEAPIGENLTNGYKLAEEDLAKKGIKIQLIWEDDTGKPQIAMSAMEKLATRDSVAGIVGPYTSACSNAAAKVAEKYAVPIVIPAASKEEITRQGLQWVFRVSATTVDYASILLDLATSAGKPKTMAILNENTDFGVSAAKAGKDIAAKKGIQIVYEEAYSKGSPDYRSTLSKVKEAKPDLVFLVSYVADAILLMRQAREIGVSPQAFLGAGAGFATVQFASEKDIANNVFSITQWTEDVSWPGAREFFERYKSKFGKEPTYHAALAYSSLLILGEEANKAAGDREKIRKQLVDGKWTGIVGDVAFEDYDGFTNQNKHEMLVMQIQNGTFETVFPAKYAPKGKKPIYPFPGWK